MESYRSWVEEVAGGRVVGAKRPATGGSRETWFVDLERDGTVEQLVLRVEGEGSFSGTEITLTREAVAYEALHGAGIPSPAILGVHPSGSAFLMTRAPGDSDLSVLGADERDATIVDFVERMADLHSLPVDRLDLPGFERPSTPEEHATLDLSRWVRLCERVDELDPLIAYTGAWLLAHAPGQVQRTAFVHGDIGPGNFVASDGKVTAFVDMEFSHLGDPMDDIAWFKYRLGVFGLPGADLLDRYASRSGLHIDEASVAYYELAVHYRCAVTTSLAVARGGGARGLAPYILQTQRYLNEVAARLSALTGIGEPAPPVPAFEVTPRTAWYDRVLSDVRAAVKAISDSSVRDETRNSQIYVQYLRAYDSIGGDVDESTASDLDATFGHAVAADTGKLVRAAADAGARQDEPALRCLLRRQSRQRALWFALLDRPRR